MASGRRMCPNEACEKFNQPTGLMGGCDCGTQLVPFKTLDEQVDEALWDLYSPQMKRLVTYALIGSAFRREGSE